MDSHIRVYIEANWNALRCLPPMAYKVLLSLVARADSFGRCFPSVDKIAEDIDANRQSVFTALEQLESGFYIGYLRRNEQDLVTGRWLPNVYIVNPHFICIGLAQQEQAQELWGITRSNSPLPSSNFSYTNQQQEPASKTNTIEPETRNNNNNQNSLEKGNEGRAHKTPNLPHEKSEKAKGKKATRQNDSETEESSQQGEAPQRSKKAKGSAANYNPHYDNPEPIAAPIPDDVLERLANRVNALGMPIAMARGFVIGYGGQTVEAALLQVAAANRKGQDIKNSAGLFRHILQNNLIDSAIPSILVNQENHYRASWSEFSENDS